jgi:hypothetical protein
MGKRRRRKKITVAVAKAATAFFLGIGYYDARRERERK